LIELFCLINQGHYLEVEDIILFHLAWQCMSIRIPLSFFKSFIVNKDGAHKNRLNIKQKKPAELPQKSSKTNLYH